MPSTEASSSGDMIQHYRTKQRQYLEWRAGRQEKQEESYYVSPHLRQLRTDWFAKRYEKYGRTDGQEPETPHSSSLHREESIPLDGKQAELHSSLRVCSASSSNKSEIDGEDKRAKVDKDR
jgi:hypothetical protein